MKRKINLAVIAISLTAFLTGCAGPPKKYNVTSTEINEESSGVVFGRVTKQRFFGLFMYNLDSGGRGVGFKNKETGEKFTYVGAHYFQMKLPKGTYEVTGLGSPAGSLMPKNKPFTFSVEPGTIKYVGSIVGDRDLLAHLEKNNISPDMAYKAIISMEEYGLGRQKGIFSSEYEAGEPFITFFIIDETDMVTRELIQNYPELSGKKIILDPMLAR